MFICFDLIDSLVCQSEVGVINCHYIMEISGKCKNAPCNWHHHANIDQEGQSWDSWGETALCAPIEWWWLRNWKMIENPLGTAQIIWGPRSAWWEHSFRYQAPLLLMWEVETPQSSLIWLRLSRVSMHEKQKIRKETCMCIMQKSPSQNVTTLWSCTSVPRARGTVMCSDGISWMAFGCEDNVGSRTEGNTSSHQLSLGQSLFSEDLQPPGLKWGTSTWAGRELPCSLFVFLSAHADLPGRALGNSHECRTAVCETLKNTD